MLWRPLTGMTFFEQIQCTPMHCNVTCCPLVQANQALECPRSGRRNEATYSSLDRQHTARHQIQDVCRAAKQTFKTDSVRSAHHYVSRHIQAFLLEQRRAIDRRIRKH
ncbi:hypothetical protein ABIC88_003900 [Pseudomonas kilonensis]